MLNNSVVVTKFTPMAVSIIVAFTPSNPVTLSSQPRQSPPPVSTSLKPVPQLTEFGASRRQITASGAPGWDYALAAGLIDDVLSWWVYQTQLPAAVGKVNTASEGARELNLRMPNALGDS